MVIPLPWLTLMTIRLFAILNFPLLVILLLARMRPIMSFTASANLILLQLSLFLKICPFCFSEVFDMPRFFSNPGSPFRAVRESFYDSSGALCLRTVGTDNIDQLIQSHAAGADIVSLARRCMLGDPSAVRADSPMYIDNVGAPKTPIDMLNTMATVRRTFESLPADKRAEYDNDFNKFFVSMFSDKTTIPGNDDKLTIEPVDTPAPVVDPVSSSVSVGGVNN
nr:virion structural protein [Microvirus sp.]